MSIYSKVTNFLREDLFTFHYLRFLAASGASAVVNVVLRIALSHSMTYVQSIVIAYVISTFLAFVFNKLFVFDVRGRAYHVQLAYFLAVNSVGLVQTMILSSVFSGFLQAFFPESMQLAETLGHIAALSTLAITSYLLHKNFTFTKIINGSIESDMENPAKKIANIDFIVATVLVGVWTVLALVVHPQGNFPLNDDWSYGRSVKVLLEQHRIYVDGWSTATFYFQAILGALFCLPGGFSFTALRISTIVLGGVGVAGLYYLLRQVTVRRDWAVCGAAALMLNPIYYENSFTFMTDVPYTTLVTIACLFLLRGLTAKSRRDEIIGFVFLCCAMLIRQIVMPVALAYGLVYLYRTKISWCNLGRAFWPAVGVQLSLMAYNFVIARLGIRLPLYDAKQRQILFGISKYGYDLYAHYALVNIYLILAYLSVFLFPLTILLISVVSLRSSKKITNVSAGKFFTTASVSVVIFIILFYINKNFFHFLGVNLYPTLALGPCDLGAHCELLHLKVSPERWFTGFVANFILAAIITITLCFLALAVIFALKRRSLKDGPYGVFAAFALLALLGTSIPFGMFNVFDRYLIPLMPFFALLLTAAGGLLFSEDSGHTKTARLPLAHAVPASVLLVYGVVAVCGTHDYLAWNRSKWSAVSDLMDRQNIAPENIEGGFAVTGWNLYATNKAVRDRFNQLFVGGSRFTMPNARYVVGFDHDSNVQTTCEQLHPGDQAKLASYPIAGWLLPSDLEVAVFERCHGRQG